jgi:hypothetical protein
MATSTEIPPLVLRLVGELAEPQPMRRGSVTPRLIKCGKAACACAEDPNARHGPYLSLTQAVAGKTRSRFLTAEQAAVAQEQIVAGRKFRERVDTYWVACEEWADAEIELPPSASSGEAQKKGSKRRSKATSSKKSKRS